MTGHDRARSTGLGPGAQGRHYTAHMRCLPLTSNAGPTLLSLLVAASTLVPGLAQAQWKWRDAQGQVNASDRPPPQNIPLKDILARPNENVRRAAAPASPASAASAASAAAATPPRPSVERELEARKRAADAEKLARTKAEEERLGAQRAENCQRARGHLASLESGQRIARVNDKGEREVLDDRARADEMRQARDGIAAECR